MVGIVIRDPLAGKNQWNDIIRAYRCDSWSRSAGVETPRPLRGAPGAKRSIMAVDETNATAPPLFLDPYLRIDSLGENVSQKGNRGCICSDSTVRENWVAFNFLSSPLTGNDIIFLPDRLRKILFYIFFPFLMVMVTMKLLIHCV